MLTSLALAVICSTYSATSETPPSWRVVPIPRWADYGDESATTALGRVAIVRRPSGPYDTERDASGELVAGRTIVAEELRAVLSAAGVQEIADLPDDAAQLEGYDTLISLGPPRLNALSEQVVAAWGLDFARWDDPNTADDDFTQWSDLGPEGYVLKTGELDGRTVILLAGHDADGDAFCGAGTFYALQSLRQLLIPEATGPRVKLAEIVDKPLVRYRGCFSGFDPSDDQQWRDTEIIPRIKANMNVYWYGNSLADYNVESASKFRYPWRPDQLAKLARFGKYCRERFVTTVFCMNADHYHVDWAAAKTLDGSAKDPLHYDPDHPVEAGIKEMWADLGFDVQNDVDVLAAKYAQLYDAVPGSVFQLMNEDDLFGLVHESDMKRFFTRPDDPATCAAEYGVARAEFLVALHRRIKELRPDSPDLLPICPPGQLCYQHVLNRDEDYSREFLHALGSTFQKHDMADVFPILTTGGGTAAEVVDVQTVRNFRDWAAGCTVQICDNNFPQGFHVGAYETNPDGPRSPHQFSEKYPAGYRDKQLFEHVWGISWNGLNDEHVLAWCQGQYMWNMLQNDRAVLNDLAVRKASTEATYPVLRAFYEEYDSPTCYLPDCQPPYRLLTVSDRVVFPSDGWVYNMAFTDEMRIECTRLLEKLTELVPQLDGAWTSPHHQTVGLDVYAHDVAAFATIYLAYGYLSGWTGPTDVDAYAGDALRDLFLAAEDLQGRFFAGPESGPGRWKARRNYYSGKTRFVYTAGQFKPDPEKPADCAQYRDIWAEGLADRYYSLHSTVQLSAADPSALTGVWSEPAAETEVPCREVSGDAAVRISAPDHGPVVLRVLIGTATNDRAKAIPVRLELGDAAIDDGAAMRRWLTWLIPDRGSDDGLLRIHTDGPVEVYEVQTWRPMTK